jgi:hypothetical protein
MRRLLLVLMVALVMVAMLVVMAAPAFSDPQGKGPQGKGVGECGVLGTAVSQSAKDLDPPGPINSVGPGAPGQTLKANCTPAGQ